MLSQPIQEKIEPNVILLGGRKLKIDFYGYNQVEDDIGNHAFDFRWASPGFDCHQSALQILRGMLSTHSTIYVSRCAAYIGRAIADIEANAGATFQSISLKHFNDWPKRYGPTTWPFVQAVLNRWDAIGLPGLEPEVVQFLRSPEKFEEEASGWYFALVANDPERGAFTEQELRSIRDGVNRAFEEGRITLADWTLVWFFIATGVRPVQIARMRMSDMIVTPGPEGTEVTLAIPLAKGDNQIVRDRWKRKAPSVLAEALLRYMTLPDVRWRASDAPLFLDQSAKVSARIEAVFRAVDTYSERLRGPIPVFPYRFRYTLGTRAIALGASDHEAARLLTHRTTHCIQYYRAAMPMLQRPIREAIGSEMTFLAQAFQGRLIGSLEEATRKGEPGALIRDFAHLVGQSLGACGTRAECHQNAPRACLSCRKFEPLADAPWERFLAVLLDDIAEETEDRIKLITQEQVDAVRGIIAERDARMAEAVQ